LGFPVKIRYPFFDTNLLFPVKSKHPFFDSKRTPTLNLQLPGGDYTFVIKITFVGRTRMIVNSLKSIDLGASFEPYGMLIRQREHSKKIKRIA